jgi:hypothetical protein
MRSPVFGMKLLNHFSFCNLVCAILQVLAVTAQKCQPTIKVNPIVKCYPCVFLRFKYCSIFIICKMLEEPQLIFFS